MSPQQALKQTVKCRIMKSMTMTLDQIVEETRDLPAEVVAELVDRIYSARAGAVDPEIDAAWKTEINRRVEEIQSGKVQGIPAEEVFEKAKRLLKR